VTIHGHLARRRRQGGHRPSARAALASRVVWRYALYSRPRGSRRPGL